MKSRQGQSEPRNAGGVQDLSGRGAECWTGLGEFVSRAAELTRHRMKSAVGFYTNSF